MTADRVARVYRLLILLAKAPQTREQLTRRLRLRIRGFYRDLDILRAVGIETETKYGHYILRENPRKALERLPFPDPGLNLREAIQLSKGRTPAHRKLRAQINRIVK
jgi:predicted DNA-binding transcriptional regulator YafY